MPREPSKRPRRSRAAGRAPAVKRRRGVVRVVADVARRIRSGHGWLYQEALDRDPGLAAGEAADVHDSEGRFLGRGLYDPDSAVAIRIWSRDPSLAIDSALVRARVEKAAKLRRRCLPDDLTAFRVVNADGDGLPGAACDRYGDYLVVYLFTAAWQPLEEALLDALVQQYEPAGIYLQRRYQKPAPDAPRPGAELMRGKPASRELEIQECGLKFCVDVTAPLAPGIFPDLRMGRELVGQHSKGFRVLNVFSYTGAFTVHAVSGGASSVSSIDLAAKSHRRARDNLARNGFGEDNCEFVVGDALAVLERLSTRGHRFDFCIIDPPTFAAGKGRPFSVRRDYGELVRATAALLSEDGMIAAACNAQKLTRDEFERACAEGGFRARTPLRVLERRGLPADFPTPAGLPEANYLKFALLGRA